MRIQSTLFLIGMVLLASSSRAQNEAQSVKQAGPGSEFPTRLTIGTHSFFDFGPPFDFYEIYLIQSEKTGTSVERITVTPPGNSCSQPATVKLERAILPQSIPVLLGGESPCKVSQKALRKEAKRCKHCLVFSGAEVTMQIECGAEKKAVDYKILDRDMYDKRAMTPEHTSYTMHMLSLLNEALGSSISDQPSFPIGDISQDPIRPPLSPSLAALGSGSYDNLFPAPHHKVSALYKDALLPRALPEAVLESSIPFTPDEHSLPAYPPIARAAHVEGRVVLQISVKQDGAVENATVISGPGLLSSASLNQVKTWKFPSEAAGTSITAEIDYKLNCPKTPLESNDKR